MFGIGIGSNYISLVSYFLIVSVTSSDVITSTAYNRLQPNSISSLPATIEEAVGKVRKIET